MSTGPRLPLARAQAAANHLIKKWRLDQHHGMVVGSVRRLRADVGDLEFLAQIDSRAPASGGAEARRSANSDDLYQTIAETTASPEDALFGSQPSSAFAEAVSGLKPWFRTASLRVSMTNATGDGETAAINVQVFRAPIEAWGWASIMRTGPAEFGVWFLRRWKECFQISAAKSASVGGMLVDPWGKPVPMRTEQECFDAIRVRFVPPEERDVFVERLPFETRREMREVMR